VREDGFVTAADNHFQIVAHGVASCVFAALLRNK